MEYRKEKCAVCKTETIYNSCPHCGWVRTCLIAPNKIHYSYNFISLNRAKELYNARKSLKPSFEDFLECMEVYAELGFVIGNVLYGVFGISKGHRFFGKGVENGGVTFNTVDEFYEKAAINGVLLRNLWDEVSEVNVIYGFNEEEYE